MFYTSTRDTSIKVSSSEAIAKGISAEGGLFVPEAIPLLAPGQIDGLCAMSYIERAKNILAMYLTDFSQQELDYCVNGAYAPGKFSSEKVAQLKKLNDKASVLELWRGPTCAFKDMALQLLPYLLTTAAGKTVKDKTVVILVATSGDTGKAALEGFKDVEKTKIMVFFPNDGVSPMQKLQMTTQEGENVAVCAINGNFDDAQSGVKAIFTDEKVLKKLEENGLMFSSANSINWGRLVPQIVYYISAYCEMINSGEIKNGDKINIAVPTGNFGNILAAYYAMRMGIPVNRLICASNANNVLTDFIETGTYDKNRKFYTTASPSMDILISSNLERLLFELCGRDDGKINEWMTALKSEGKYSVDAEILEKIKEVFVGGCCDDTLTAQTIGEVFKEENYLCDTHTAVGVRVYEEYAAKTGDETKTVIASTANPYKFAKAVLSAVGGSECDDEFERLDILRQTTGEECPVQLSSLKTKSVRFSKCCEKDEMSAAVLSMLGIE